MANGPELLSSDQTTNLAELPQPRELPISSTELVERGKRLRALSKELRIRDYGKYALMAQWIDDLAGSEDAELVARGHDQLVSADTPMQEALEGREVFPANYPDSFVH